MFKAFKVELDISNRSLNDVFEVSSNDLNTIRLDIRVKEGFNPLDLSGKIVRLAIQKPDGTVVFQSGGVTNGGEGLCEIILSRQANLIGGKHEAELMIYEGESAVAVTTKFSYKVNEAILSNNKVKSTSDFPAISQAIAAGEALKDINVPEFVEAATSAVEAGDNANVQAIYAQNQGDYAKFEADKAAERLTELEGLSVVSLQTEVKGKANISYVDTKVSSVASGSPKGTYATVAALQTAFPTGNTSIYVVTATGNWYYWNGTAWTSGGTYQSSGVADRSITANKTDFIKISENRFNKDHPDNKLGFYLNTTGVETATGAYYITHKIDVVPGEEFTIRKSELAGGVFYKVDGSFLQKIGPASGVSEPFTFTVPASASYMRINGTDKTKIGTDMVAKGNVYPSEYIPYAVKLDDPFQLSTAQKTEVDSIINVFPVKEENLSSIIQYEKSDNVFDLSKITTGNFLSGAGVYTANSGYYTSDFIPVNNGDTVRYDYDSSMGTNNKLFLFDNNKVYITSVDGTPDATNDYKTVILNSANVKYVRVSHINSKQTSAMLTVNKAYPANFIPFSSKKYLNQSFGLSPTQKAEISNQSPLTGKIVSFNGDSIAAGAGYAGGFGKIIADRNGMIYENKAVGGATIAAEQYNSGVPRHWISRTISTMRTDAEYIILEGGVNDSSLSVPLGTVTTDYVTSLVDSTFCGAFESMLKQTILRYQGKKIGFVITHKMNGNFLTYYNLMIEMLNKWGIPYCDLYKNVPSLNYIAELKAIYTKDSDGWHPNELGYKKYYCDKIEAFMKTL